MLHFSDLNVTDQTVLIREDFNVPMQNGHISNEARLVAALPTLKMAIEKGAKVIVLSHLGRPEEGHFDPQFSLEPVAKRLSELLQFPVRLEKEWLDKPLNPSRSEIILCENTRFCVGEKKNQDGLSKRMAALGSVFVMDAFAVAHRAESSTVGIAHYVRTACAGPLLIKELEALSKVLENPVSPVVAIVGGSKVSTKIGLLEKLLEKVDILVLGGGIANTFLASQGFNMGASLMERDWIHQAADLFLRATQKGKKIWLPQDARVATKFDAGEKARVCSLSDIQSNEQMLDIGPKSEDDLKTLIAQAGTILWNGPLGVFEFPEFSHGTEVLAQSIAASSAYSVAGGGDTVSAIEQFGVETGISYVSTGGGAFLELLEGKTLPGIAVL